MLFRLRPSAVLAWPAWELDLVREYLARQPAPEERVEILLARLAAMYATVHAKEGAPAAEPAAFLAYLDPWPQGDAPAPRAGRYTEADLSFIKLFGTRTR